MNELPIEEIQSLLETEIPEIASMEICDLGLWKTVEGSTGLSSRFIDKPELQELVGPELKRLEAERNQCIRFQTHDGQQGYVTYVCLFGTDFVLVSFLMTDSERAERAATEEHPSMSDYYRSMKMSQK